MALTKLEGIMYIYYVTNQPTITRFYVTRNQSFLPSQMYKLLSGGRT